VSARATGAWQHVAAYFAGNPNLLGYDTYNEPFPGSNIWGCLVPAVGCPAQDAVLTAFDKKVTTAIRHADPDTMIFSEPWFTYDVGYPTSLGATGDAHAGFSFHDYCPFASIAALYGLLCPSFNTDVFSNADAHSGQTGDALLTEFGATDDTSVLSSVVADGAQYKVGWLVWAYCGCGDPTTTGSASAEGIVNNPELPPTGSNVNQATLAALAVPHPELVAGPRCPTATTRRPARSPWTTAPSGRTAAACSRPARRPPSRCPPSSTRPAIRWR
jgi:endoglycosylceramidase